MTPALALVATMTIVGLGDSTTAGTPAFASPVEMPPAGAGNPESQYEYWMMKARPGWTVLNRGVNGERSDQIRARFAREVEAAKPKVVIILAGVNDIYQGRPAKATESDLLWMYRRAKALGIAPVAATVLPFTRAAPEQSERIERLNRWIRETAAKEEIRFCDTARAAADPKEPRRLKTSPDGLHPDAATYRAVGEALVRCLSERHRRE